MKCMDSVCDIKYFSNVVMVTMTLSGVTMLHSMAFKALSILYTTSMKNGKGLWKMREDCSACWGK